MARLIIELTNRCNLRCQHCFGERHAATGDFPLPLLDKVLSEGKSCGIDHICFSGGEPTIHRHFDRIVRRVSEADYAFSFVSNGLRFNRVVPLLVSHRTHFRGVTFSLDGAREATHDRLRGGGSYRQVMRAATQCVFSDLPFTLNMVLTADNKTETDDLVHLGTRLGSLGVRFGHLMMTPETRSRGLDLSPVERREVENRIWALKQTASIFVGMAPGYYSESPFFPCAPLELEEFNLDYRGNMTLCCQLSGHDGKNGADDVIANVGAVSVTEACQRFRQRVEAYLAEKRRRVAQGSFSDLDHFPCWYCVKAVGSASSEAALSWPLFDAAHGQGPRRLHVVSSPQRPSAS